MRQHDGFGFATDSSFDLARIDVVSPKFDIDEYRYCAKLQDWIDRGGASCNANHHHPAIVRSPSFGR